MDKLDQKLILELQRDGRQSYSDLGKILGVTEGTMRKRLKSLIKRGIIKVVAAPTLEELGYNFVSIVGIQVRMAELEKVQQILSQNRAVCELAWVTGRYDLIATVVTRSTREFADFMANELSIIPAVVRTETFVNLGMIKGAVSLADTIEIVRNCDIPSLKKTQKSVTTFRRTHTHH